MSRHRTAWTIRRLLTGAALNGELKALSEPFRSLACHLDTLPAEARLTAWEGFLCGRPDAEDLREALIEADPFGPSPEDARGRPFATLADIARIVSDQPWLWRGWIARGVLNVVASEPGTGKTRFGLDLARRLWFRLDFPDGQPNEWPEGTRTLWVQGDRNFAEMLTAARAFGLPDEAVALGSSPDDPTGALDLDDPDALAALGERIEAAAPALVVIDTVGMVTAFNLCRPEDARAFFAPVMELAGRLGVAFLGLTHLSSNKEALGRRIVEKARVVLKMTQPDPEGQPDRRRLWVDKSAVVKPPPLGVTMGDEGNVYDFNPPTEPEPNKGGRPAEEREKAEAFIRDALSRENDRVGNDLRAEWELTGGKAKTFWRAADDMEAAGELTTDGGPGQRKPKVLHLNKIDTEPGRPF